MRSINISQKMKYQELGSNTGICFSNSTIISVLNYNLNPLDIYFDVYLLYLSFTVTDLVNYLEIERSEG